MWKSAHSHFSEMREVGEGILTDTPQHAVLPDDAEMRRRENYMKVGYNISVLIKENSKVGPNCALMCKFN